MIYLLIIILINSVLFPAQYDIIYFQMKEKERYVKMSQ